MDFGTDVIGQPFNLPGNVTKIRGVAGLLSQPVLVGQNSSQVESVIRPFVNDGPKVRSGAGAYAIHGWGTSRNHTLKAWWLPSTEMGSLLMGFHEVIQPAQIQLTVLDPVLVDSVKPDAEVSKGPPIELRPLAWRALRRLGLLRGWRPPDFVGCSCFEWGGDTAGAARIG